MDLLLINLFNRKRALLLFFFVLLHPLASGAQNLDSLLQRLPLAPDDTNKVYLLENIIFLSYYRDPNPQHTLPYVKMIRELSDRLGYARGQAASYMYYADYLEAIGEEEQALRCVDSARVIYSRHNYTFGLANVSSHMASYYRGKAEYEKALEYYQETYDLYEKISEKRGQALALASMALLFGNLERYDDAENYYLRCLKIREETGDRRGMSHALMNLGVLQNDQKKYDKALNYFKLCLEIQKDLGDIVIIAGCQINMGNIYVARGEYEKALKTFEDSYASYVRLGDTVKIAYSLMYQCITYRNMKQYENALRVLEQGYDLIKHKKDMSLDLAGFQMEFYNLYKAMGNYKKALAAYELVNEYRSGIFSSETADKISELKEKYETGKKEQENINLKRNSEIQELELRQRLYLVYGTAGLALLILFISVLLIRNNRIRSEQHTMQLEQRLLRSQMNPHFIFNALTAIQSFMMKNNPAEAGRFLSAFARIMRSILENSREEYIALAKEVQWLQNYISLQELRFENGFDYRIYVDEELDLENTWIPPMLTQPFIENALEHGFRDMEEKGMLEVNFRRQDRFLEVDVKDNGKGFGPGDSKQESPGKKSLAMQITRERLELLNKGKRRKIHFRAESVQGEGTMVTFRIPLKKKF